MWANAQPDGRPAEYRWRPLFNAAKFGWRPLLDAVQWRCQDAKPVFSVYERGTRQRKLSPLTFVSDKITVRLKHYNKRTKFVIRKALT